MEDSARLVDADHATIGPDDFRGMMARWVTGVAVVTCRSGDQPVGCTVNALAAVSLAPPLLMVSLRTASQTLAAINKHGRFALNVLSVSQSWLGHRFARAGRGERFAGVDYRWVEELPVLSGALVGAVCAVTHRFQVADHVLVVAEARSEVERGLVDPAVFFHRTYWRLSDVDYAGDAG